MCCSNYVVIIANIKLEIFGKKVVGVFILLLAKAERVYCWQRRKDAKVYRYCEATARSKTFIHLRG
jgi:hypothetical protein